MRIFLIVLLILVLLVMFICMSGVVVAVRFWDGKLEWSVRYLGIRILPRRTKKKKAGSSGILERLRKRKAGKPDESEEEKKPKDFLMDKLWKLMQNIAEKADMAGSAWFALPEAVQKLLRGMTWYDIETDFVIGGEDAAECARLYDNVQGILHVLLGSASHLVKVKRKKIAIACDFTADTSCWNCGCRFRVRIGALAAMGISLVWQYFMDGRKAGKQLVNKRL